MKPLSLFLFLLFLIVHLPHITHSWKKDEFGNCNQTPFCKRSRAFKPTSLQSSSNPPTETPSSSLSLRLPRHVVRFKIDEDPTLNPKQKKRLQGSGFILPQFESSKLWLQWVGKERIGGDLVDSLVVYVNDDYKIVLCHDPFEVFVRGRSGNGSRAVSVNSHRIFDSEQLRKKNEEED